MNKELLKQLLEGNVTKPLKPFIDSTFHPAELKASPFAKTSNKKAIELLAQLKLAGFKPSAFSYAVFIELNKLQFIEVHVQPGSNTFILIIQHYSSLAWQDNATSKRFPLGKNALSQILRIYELGQDEQINKDTDVWQKDYM